MREPAGVYYHSVLGLESWRCFPASLGERVQRRGRVTERLLARATRPIFRSTHFSTIFSILALPVISFVRLIALIAQSFITSPVSYLKSADFVRLLLRVHCRVVRTKKPRL
jgi:hypothetical protein